MNFNTSQFAAIVENAKAKAANSPRWLRAIERAAEGLASGELCVTLLSSYALVTSSNGSYRVNGHCECEAARRGHQECKHRASVRLVEMMEAAPTAAPAPRVPSRIIRSANWYGRRSGNAMVVDNWLV